MPAQTLLVDSPASLITLRTRAEGLLARMAHDLELAAPVLRGRATREGDTWTADLRLTVAALRVVGVLHGAALDRAALSASDRAQIEEKMRQDIFFGGVHEVSATARGTSLTSGEATISLGPRSQQVPLTLKLEPSSEGKLKASGQLTLSLEKLGVKPIKGPLGAFRVKDAVEVLFSIPLSED
jgi:hypothetical protein